MRSCSCSSSAAPPRSPPRAGCARSAKATRRSPPATGSAPASPIDIAPRAPDAAAPHFWSGLAFYAKSRGDGTPDEQFGWLSRAEEELRRAVEAEPADWDAKYDFELVTRLAAALRKSPKVPPNQLMQLLRPQPRPGTKPGRHIG